jgi:hypothetical protein
MPRRPKRRGSNAQEFNPPFAQSAGLHQIDEHLNRIFFALAQLLLRHGYGHGRLTKLTKLAFVDAAKTIDLGEKVRHTNARVAALTGLTRLEVSRLVKGDRSQLVGATDRQNRATRVALGWLTDSAFSDARRKPRPLPFKPRGGGFNQLVKKYSGDIPARAMLKEMIRLGMVKINRSGVVSLVRRSPSLSRATTAAIRAISPWVDVVAVASNSQAGNVLDSDIQQVRLYFASRSEALAAARELEGRWNSLVTGVQLLGTTTKNVGAYEVVISLATATADPRFLGFRRK